MGRWAAVQGFKNLYTLEKGIQNYLKEKGDDMWFGSLFVFDARMAVRPGDIPVSSSFYLNTDPQQTHQYFAYLHELQMVRRLC